MSVADLHGKIGHNSQAAEAETATTIAVERLQNIVSRIERLEEERSNINSDIKDIYTEAASAGFDKKVLRQLIALRRKDPEEIAELEALLDVYRKALG